MVEAARAEDTVAESTLKVIKREVEPKPILLVVQGVQKLLPELNSAMIKAAVLRLHFMGLIEVTPDWKVKSR